MYSDRIIFGFILQKLQDEIQSLYEESNFIYKLSTIALQRGTIIYPMPTDRDLMNCTLAAIRRLVQGIYYGINIAGFMQDPVYVGYPNLVVAHTMRWIPKAILQVLLVAAGQIERDKNREPVVKSYQDFVSFVTPAHLGPLCEPAAFFARMILPYNLYLYLESRGLKPNSPETHQVLTSIINRLRVAYWAVYNTLTHSNQNIAEIVYDALSDSDSPVSQTLEYLRSVDPEFPPGELFLEMTEQIVEKFPYEKYSDLKLLEVVTTRLLGSEYTPVLNLLEKDRFGELEDEIGLKADESVWDTLVTGPTLVSAAFVNVTSAIFPTPFVMGSIFPMAMVAHSPLMIERMLALDSFAEHFKQRGSSTDGEKADS